jgi:ribosomal protein S18 acetylase RimI-like enzyme
MQKSYYAQNKKGKELEFIINDAKPEDFNEIVKNFRLIQDSVYPEWFHTSEGDIAKSVIDNEGFALVVRYDGKIVAFGSAATTGERANTLAEELTNYNIKIPKGKNAEIHDIFVHHGLRGYGLQKILIDVLCDEAASRGSDIVFVTVHPENIYSSRNFDKCGFIRANSEPLTKYNSKRDYWFKIIV